MRNVIRTNRNKYTNIIIMHSIFKLIDVSTSNSKLNFENPNNHK